MTQTESGEGWRTLLRIVYAPRGPIAAGDPVDAVAARALALAGWARDAGGTILAVDPELDAHPRYESALAAALIRLFSLSDSARAGIGRHGRAWVMEHFDAASI